MKVNTYDQSEQISQLLSDRIEDQNLRLKFKLKQGQYCNYANEVRIDATDITKISDKLQISNRVCKQHEGQLQKVTIIRIGGRQVTIRDRYCFPPSQPSETIESNTQKKQQLFKKSMRTSNRDGNGEKATKNLAKNFLKAFLNYMHPLREHLNEEAKKKIKEFESRKYNNTVIKQIIKDENLFFFFKDFVLNKANEWIQNSKIKDKELHLGAVKMFEKMINKKETEKNKIKIENHDEDEIDCFNPQIDNLRYQFRQDNRGFSSDFDEDSLMANCGASDKNQ